MNLLSHTITADPSAMSDAELDASLAYLARWMPLFDGLPSGISLFDAALVKFHRRDPLGIAFMQTHEVAA
jgi:hypothetical protein